MFPLDAEWCCSAAIPPLPAEPPGGAHRTCRGRAAGCPRSGMAVQHRTPAPPGAARVWPGLLLPPLLRQWGLCRALAGADSCWWGGVAPQQEPISGPRDSSSNVNSIFMLKNEQRNEDQNS